MSDAQIFQLFSIVYLAIGVGMLINPGFYKKLFTDFAENAAAMYIGGVAALAIGFVILVHRGLGCTHDWSMILSIIGWLALIKGLLILVCPKLMMALTKAMIKDSLLKVWPVVIIILGLALSFFGFCPKSPI
ncbi:MAG: hypothetical protein ACYTEN_12410 [Planctomycetota bacterium]|jgi:uncharacterized protein YjeT (DUF2065 family)